MRTADRGRLEPYRPSHDGGLPGVVGRVCGGPHRGVGGGRGLDGRISEGGTGGVVATTGVQDCVPQAEGTQRGVRSRDGQGSGLNPHVHVAGRAVTGRSGGIEGERHIG